MATIDPLIFGHRVRHYRKAGGMTLDDLGAKGVEACPVPLPSREREEGTKARTDQRSLSCPQGVDVSDLLSVEAPSRRAELEVSIERAQRDQAYRDLGLALSEADHSTRLSMPPSSTS